MIKAIIFFLAVFSALSQPLEQQEQGKLELEHKFQAAPTGPRVQAPLSPVRPESGQTNLKAQLERLALQMAQGDQEARRRAIRSLGELGLKYPKETIPLLIKSLVNEEWEDEEIKNEAVQVLVKLGPPVIPFLLETADDTESASREGAIETIGAIGGRQTMIAIPLLAKILRHDPSQWVRSQAALALTNIPGRRANDLLVEASVRDQEEVVRVDARQALAQRTKELRNIEVHLLRIALGKEEVRALRALSALDALPKSIQTEAALIRILYQTSGETQNRAAEILSARSPLQTKEHRDAVLKILKE